MITQDKIDRINELARKAKSEGLTDEEIVERDLLRREYIEAFKENLRAQLENIKFVDKESVEDNAIDNVIEDVIDDAIVEIDEEISEALEDIEKINPDKIC